MEIRVISLRDVIGCAARQAMLSVLCEDGWRLVAVDDGWAYLERPAKESVINNKPLKVDPPADVPRYVPPVKPVRR